MVQEWNPNARFELARQEVVKDPIKYLAEFPENTNNQGFLEDALDEAKKQGIEIPRDVLGKLCDTVIGRVLAKPQTYNAGSGEIETVKKIYAMIRSTV